MILILFHFSDNVVPYKGKIGSKCLWWSYGSGLEYDVECHR